MAWQLARHRSGWITGAAILISFLGHLAFLYLAPGWTIEPLADAQPPSAISTPARGLELVVVASEQPVAPIERPAVPVVTRSVPPVEIDSAAADSLEAVQ